MICSASWSTERPGSPEINAKAQRRKKDKKFVVLRLGAFALNSLVSFAFSVRLSLQVASFTARDEQVLVLAFGHTSRKPGSWRHRLKP
ncbi:hypothetical protein [Sorangium sp. So ce513]|uniref:hypothetical protein n=1 Tax=Sorangium sp. So ce513 TaxID=3133315 RepID=UPI003F5D75E2